jgi:hypothetical protein
MGRIAPATESAYVHRRLRPVLALLRTEAAIREQFLLYASVRGGDTALNSNRLAKTWQKSRKPQFSAFFTLLLAEFGLKHGYLTFAHDDLRAAPLPPRRSRARPRARRKRSR